MPARELELKLAADDSFSLPQLDPEASGVASLEERPALNLRSTYYDTADLRLVRHGIALRYRSGDAEGSGWTLKLPDEADEASRAELRFEGKATRVPDAAKDLITAYARGSSLAPIARLRTRRRRWSLLGGDGSELAELADDKVSVLERGRVVGRFRELEVESRTLDKRGLERVAAILHEAGADVPKPVPKLLRALGAKAALPPDVHAPERVPPPEPAAFAIQAALARSVQRILTSDPGVRLGDVEPLHQMRVGMRRLRSDLRTFAPLVDSAWADPLRAELRWLAGLLGDVRDLDVLRDRLVSTSSGLEGELALFLELLDERDRVARAALLEALRSKRYVDLLQALVQAARSPAVESAAWQPSREVLPPLVAGAWKTLARRGRLLKPGEPEERFHRVRILAKRTRYAAEAAAPALGSKRGKRAAAFARGAARVQDPLGVLRDSIVARAFISEVAAARRANRGFHLAAGRLVERQERDADEARGAFYEAWDRLDRPRHRKWFSK